MRGESRSPQTDVTVVICTLGRREGVLETLYSLAEQELERPWRVLVVENGGTDGTVDAVRETAQDYPVPLDVIVENRRGLSFGRNTALANVQSPVLIFIDDDVSPQPGWLAHLADAFDDPDVIGAGGRIRPVMPDAIPAWWDQILPEEVGGPTARYEFGDEGCEIRDDGGPPLPFGANMAVRTAVAREVGGFRTDLGWGKRMVPSEETEFFRRVAQRPGRILYVPESIVEHRLEASRMTREYYLKWNRGFGRATILMDPPDGRWARWSRVPHFALKALRWRCRAEWRKLHADPRKEFAARRRHARAEGSLYELMGM